MNMKNLILTSVITLTLTGCAGQVPFVKVGAGYKVDETEMVYFEKTPVFYPDEPMVTNTRVHGNKNPSARIDIGLEDGNWTYGISHHSNWFQGWPVNGDGEYQKTEVFVDYTFRFKPLK